jgi:WD40 repeat protein
MRLWDVQRGKEIRSLEGHSDFVRSVASYPDARYALSGSNDKSVRLWDVQTGQEIRRFDGYVGYVLGVAFSPDRHDVLFGSQDASCGTFKPEKKLAASKDLWMPRTAWHSLPTVVMSSLEAPAQQ